MALDERIPVRVIDEARQQVAWRVIPPTASAPPGSTVAARS